MACIYQGGSFVGRVTWGPVYGDRSGGGLGYDAKFIDAQGYGGDMSGKVYWAWNANDAVVGLHYLVSPFGILLNG